MSERRPSRLLHAMKAGRIAADTLKTRTVVGGGHFEPDVSDLVRHLEQAEPKIEQGLSQRVLALGLIRGVELALTRTGQAQGPEAQRARRLHQRLREREEAQFGPRRRRLKEGSYSKDEFFQDLEGLSPQEQDAFAERLLDLHDPPPSERRHDAQHAPHGLSPLDEILRASQEFGPDDVVYDLGSGTGKVCFLLRFLTGAQVVGVEYDPALVQEAERARAALGLSVRFDCADVQEISCADATGFFMYEPFRGPILDAAMAMMRNVAQARSEPVKLVARFKTYDPWADIQGLESWSEPSASGQRVFRVLP